MSNFKELDFSEMVKINGGLFVIDDAIFWSLVGAGFAAGVATGISRKSRKVNSAAGATTSIS